MKISLSWLNEFVDIEDYFSKPQVFAEILTFAGLEVESMENLSEKFSHIQVGLILKKEKHPEADRLSVCQVTTGHGIIHQIVCGAKNHNENDRVVVALPGASLPGGLQIKESVLRNISSKGMLCSKEELGMEKDEEGIWILPPEAPIGESFSRYWGYEDVILELKVTPNRADCLSHLGLAREVSALLNRPLKKGIFNQGESLETIRGPGVNPFQIQRDENLLCPAYYGAYFEGVKIGPSPLWLKQKIEKLGLKSINNVVDVTNLVMFEFGQPLHAFDSQCIQGKNIFIRLSRENEQFQSLDGTHYHLKSEELVIADDQSVLAVAGVVGGQKSSVTDSTTTLFLEVAAFDSTHVRKVSRALGIQTDSAYRFSRGVDKSLAPACLIQTIEYLKKTSGAQLVGDILSNKSADVTTRPISVRVPFVSQKLGYKVEFNLFVELMKRLGCGVEVVSIDQQELQIQPPSWRFDLEQEVDFIEEFSRLHGYDKIPETLPALKSPPTSHQKEYLFIKNLSLRSLTSGLTEVVLPFLTNGLKESVFLNSQNLKNWGFLPGPSIELKNPLSEESSHLRRQLSMGLVERGLYNIRQGAHKGALFEIGTVAAKDTEGLTYKESYHWASIQWGMEPLLWQVTPQSPLVLDLKERVQSVFQKQIEFEKPRDRSLLPGFLHRGQAAWIKCEGEIVGFIGHLHPAWLDENKVRLPFCVAEVNLQTVIKAHEKSLSYQPFSRYPLVERDLALVVPFNRPALDLENCFRETLNQYLQGFELFDIYEGDKLPSNHRQLAYRLKFQSSEGTLQEQTIQSLIGELLEKLKNQYGIQLREG